MAIAMAKVTYISRGKEVKIGGGQKIPGSIVAVSAYNARVCLRNEIQNIDYDFSHLADIRAGVEKYVCGGMILPSHAPEKFKDRETFWNAVENAERNIDGSIRKNAQLGQSIVLGLPHEDLALNGGKIILCKVEVPTSAVL